LVLIRFEGVEECRYDFLDDVIGDLVVVEFVEEEGEIVVADKVVVEYFLKKVAVEGIKVSGSVFEKEADVYEGFLELTGDIDVENVDDLGVLFGEYFLDFVLSFDNGFDEGHDVDESGGNEHGKGLLFEDVFEFVEQEGEPE
jgi:hypothetical protein